LYEVDLICHLEFVPAERGSVDSYGAPYERSFNEYMSLVSAYIDGTDIDIVAIIALVFIDVLEKQALADMKAYK
jgi:hypothetical protein